MEAVLDELACLWIDVLTEIHGDDSAVGVLDDARGILRLHFGVDQSGLHVQGAFSSLTTRTVRYKTLVGDVRTVDSS